MQESCESCRFSRPTSKLPDTLECRRQPPVQGNRPTAVWPLVYPGAWCGEYEGDPPKASRPRAGAKESRPAATADETR